MQRRKGIEWRNGTGTAIRAGIIEQMEYKIIIRRMGAAKSTGQMDTY
jgi:hypothetical protein